MSYGVKQLSSGEFGVYDYSRGSYPVQRPELAAAGVDRIEGNAPSGWFKGPEGEAEATRICEALNSFYGAPAVSSRTSKPKATRVKRKG